MDSDSAVLAFAIAPRSQLLAVCSDRVSLTAAECPLPYPWSFVAAASMLQ